MSILTVLYNLLIGPLELLFEVIYSLANKLIGNPGLSIIFLSLVVNFLVLPLYKQADAMQEESRDTEQRLSHWVKHIKKTFSGDERFMILQTYYRQNNYKPTDALKGSMSLLLEIPFFMAAYNFLSELQLLHGASFGPIENLGSPDGLLVIAGVTINVLPILMTVINLVSGAIYTKGFPAKAKVQLYGMAVIFLVLLYDSPSGLVFYWTLNNLFSLGKNIFYKLKNPKLVMSILSAVSGICLGVYVLLNPMGSLRRQVFVLALAGMLILPVVVQFVGKKGGVKPPVEVTKQDRFLFHAGCVLIAVLTGLLIPSAVIKASPEEFINAATLNNPLMYVLNAASMAAGLFLVWFGIFYMLASPSGKKWMGLGMWALSGIAVVNYMFFGTDYGTLSPTLQFNTAPLFSSKVQLINLLVLAAVTGALYLIWRKKAEIAKVTYLAAIIAGVGMSAFNIHGIQAVVPDAIASLKAQQQELATIPLDQQGKNVVVIMMDRAISGYIPYIFNEKPEVAQQFAGFTYYPNTTSFGGFTNVGSPVLYGGYEYTPVEMNRRDTEPLEQKHNEALKVMPVLFSGEGYETTVCDPTYAGYRWIPDLSIYDKYPDIHAYNTMGKFQVKSPELAEAEEKILSRNFFSYSLFRIAPVAAHGVLYAEGSYLNPNVGLGQTVDGLSKAVGTKESFLRSYGVLKSLPEITNVTQQGQNTFVMLSNDTTHEPMLLQTPQYEPAEAVDNREYDALHRDGYTIGGRQMRMENADQVTHYHANMAAMLRLGSWFDHLRENGVYDNTRIIIVSDHGKPLGQFDDMKFGEKSQEDAMFYNALLMVKDFGSDGFVTDERFMTIGDVPSLAMEGLIGDPVNPFTGKPINTDAKMQEQRVLYSWHWDVNENNGNTFMPGEWFSVKDDIFDMNNWKSLGEEQPED